MSSDHGSLFTLDLRVDMGLNLCIEGVYLLGACC